MPTLAQMRTRVDSWLSAKWSSVVARQESYFESHGRYWQGLRTHADPPSHTTQEYGDLQADRLDSSPSDQPSRWQDVFPEWLSELLPARVWIDVYESPAGHGWVATIEASHNGTLYRRSQNVGPETWRTQAWHAVR